MNRARAVFCLLNALAVPVLLTGCAGGGRGDASGPKQAARSYLQAVRDDNVSAAERCVLVHGRGGAEAGKLFVELTIVPRQFSRLCRERFGQDPPGAKGGDAVDDQAVNSALAAVQNARVRITGNTATLSSGARALDSLGLDSANQPLEKSLLGWRLVLDQNFGASPGQFMQKGQEGWRDQQELRIVRQVMAEIRAGKLKSIDDVMAAINTKGEALDKGGKQ